MKRLLVSVLIGVSLVLAGVPAAFADDVVQLIDSGDLTSVVPGPTPGCNSNSILSGPILASYCFNDTAVVPDPGGNPDVIVILGGSVIESESGDGVIFSSDSVWLNLITGEAIHLWDFIDGTGAFEDVSGSMAASAIVDFAADPSVTPPITGQYVAQIFVEADDGDSDSDD